MKSSTTLYQCMKPVDDVAISFAQQVSGTLERLAWFPPMGTPLDIKLLGSNR